MHPRPTSARPWLLALVLVAAILSGCTSNEDDKGTDSTTDSASSGSSASSSKAGSATKGAGTNQSGTSTGTPGSNKAPTASLNASVLAGAAPLAVSFALNGTDPEGAALAWVLSFGDNSTNATGTSLPANATHTFNAAGTYAATLHATDAGNLSATVTLNITVSAGGPVPAPEHFEDSVTGIPYIPLVGSPNSFYPGASVTHTFTTATPATSMTITLAYEEGLFFTDLDLFITGPGVDTSGEAAGPEPPVVIASPQAGEWSIEVFAYGGEGEVAYTLDVTFA
ncbi:MAG: PKD domain-containing protein [Candidatus Thermoplasmatota archaeon]